MTLMRMVLVSFIALPWCIWLVPPAQAHNPDVIRYLECRADNESSPSLVGIDETAKKVCDREAQDTWFAPSIFDAAEIEWNSGVSTKAIYRKGKHKHYEHDLLFLVHIGHCRKAAAPPSELCKG
jgi:hypothetical protein